jgi:serine/threonine protein kinase
VAVRSGPCHLNDSIDRQEFLRECRLLATLRHTNVAKLIGVAMSEEPHCTILEHSLYGDLYHYLRQINKIIGPPAKASPTAGNVDRVEGLEMSHNSLGFCCRILQT